MEHGAHGSLELNHGAKWVVDRPMMAHIRNLEKAVAEFEASPSHDHAALAAAIEEHLGKLVTNCTMKGKAHDELHKWLMPFIGLSADYSKAADAAVREEKFAQIKNSLAEFNRYFE